MNRLGWDYELVGCRSEAGCDGWVSTASRQVNSTVYGSRWQISSTISRQPRVPQCLPVQWPFLHSGGLSLSAVRLSVLPLCLFCL